MPVIFTFMGFRFMFFANDHEPALVHVAKHGATAKFFINPISLAYNKGFNPPELELIKKVLTENEAVVNRHWASFFNRKR